MLDRGEKLSRIPGTRKHSLGRLSDGDPLHPARRVIGFYGAGIIKDRE